MAHLVATSQPETFPGISTTKPPSDGELKILENRLAVDRRKRPHHDGVPCAFCSSRTGKWLNGGFLIWCAETKAIYVIGPKCGSDGVFAKKVQAADNEFRRTIGARRTAELLEAHLRATDARLAWIATHEPVARLTDALAASLKRPIELARALRSAFKSDLLPGAGGGLFLQGGSTCAERLAARKADLEALLEPVDGDPGAWAAALPPSTCLVRLKGADRILEDLQAVENRIRSAANFLGPAGVRALTLWSGSERAPASLRAEQTATKVRLWWNGNPVELAVNSIAPPTAVA